MYLRPWALLLLLQCISGAGGGRASIRAVHVPRYARAGQDVRLGCVWAAPPKEEGLYSVKWYFNGREFFRYKPRERPSKAVLPQPGLAVDAEASTGSEVLLLRVQESSSGRYKCEVTAEWPGFHTADRSSVLDVVEVPEEKPRITGTKSRYLPGDLASLTCTSPRSRPPPRLTWYINDLEAPPQYLVPPEPGPQVPGDGEEARLGLAFRVLEEHLERGEIRFRCSAAVPSLYHKTRQHSVQAVPFHGVPVMESRDVTASGAEGSGGARSPIVAVMTVVVVVTVVVVSHHC